MPKKGTKEWFDFRSTQLANVEPVLREVETGGEKDPDNAIGDGGKAVGRYQIHEVAVEEANRLAARETRRLGVPLQVFTPDDRRDPEKARRMLDITMRFHFDRGRTNLVDLAGRWHDPYSATDPEYKEKVIKAIQKLGIKP